MDPSASTAERMQREIGGAGDKVINLDLLRPGHLGAIVAVTTNGDRTRLSIANGSPASPMLLTSRSRSTGKRHNVPYASTCAGSAAEQDGASHVAERSRRRAVGGECPEVARDQCGATQEISRS